MAEETEKIYVIPLKKKNYRSSVAAPTAMKRMKQYLMKHMKVDEKDIWIDAPLNHEIWKHGKYDMPNKLRVKAVKFDDGVVEVYLPELEFTKSRREILQEEKAKKTPILLKEEEAEDEKMEPEGDEYDVVPTADGDVKIKKKKAEKEQEESEEEPSEKPSPKPVEPSEEKEKESEKKESTEKPKDKPKEEKPESSSKKEEKKPEKQKSKAEEEKTGDKPAEKSEASSKKSSEKKTPEKEKKESG